ncbi:uncharacterized protein LOC135500137 [Lineus longissimus]|uniref:uncharacterized protein LOC135500137 n=1 Tax=Lineus longissimus TaxID=88925 RepID=UPI00315DBA1C
MYSARIQPPKSGTEAPSTQIDLAFAKASLLPNKLKEVLRIDTEKEALTKDDTLEKVVTEHEDYSSKIQEKYAFYLRAIKRLQEALTAPPKASDEPVETTASTSPATTKSNVRLPKLLLPTFSGSIVEWNTFFDSFKAAIDNNVNLSKVEKMQYLRGQLKGEPKLAIEGLQLTDANYDIALDNLKECYGSTDKTKQQTHAYHKVTVNYTMIG